MYADVQIVPRLWSRWVNSPQDALPSKVFLSLLATRPHDVRWWRRLFVSFRPSVLRQSFIVFVGRRFWDTHEIRQGEGGEQGDPLMFLFFALGQHRALR